jgi:hypothetical protein
MDSGYTSIFEKNKERRLILVQLVIGDSCVWNVFLDAQTLMEFGLRET